MESQTFAKEVSQTEKLNESFGFPTFKTIINNQRIDQQSLSEILGVLARKSFFLKPKSATKASVYSLTK